MYLSRCPWYLTYLVVSEMLQLFNFSYCDMMNTVAIYAVLPP